MGDDNFTSSTKKKSNLKRRGKYFNSVNAGECKISSNDKITYYGIEVEFIQSLKQMGYEKSDIDNLLSRDIVNMKAILILFQDIYNDDDDPNYDSDPYYAAKAMRNFLDNSNYTTYSSDENYLLGGESEIVDAACNKIINN